LLILLYGIGVVGPLGDGNCDDGVYDCTEFRGDITVGGGVVSVKARLFIFRVKYSSLKESTTSKTSCLDFPWNAANWTSSRKKSS
uniref:Secreted protein n=1 Tax=Haemonchus placei TaxID=6290 RepID=A0A0N4XA71_HAEPC